MLIHGPGTGHTVTAPLGSSVSGFNALLSVKKWFTTVRAVMGLYFRATGGGDIVNEEIILLSNAAARLKQSSIKPDSEQVKKINEALPPDILTVTAANSWTGLSHGDIVRGTVRVFDEGEDERLLAEGAGYEIDYKSGRIRILQQQGTPGSAKGTGAEEGSGIASFPARLVIEQKIVVHYSYYSAYLKDSDYHINYKNGLLSRRYDGSIAAGEKVFVDYTTETNIDHVVVEEAIDQAHTAVMQRIPRELEGAAPDGLKFAETYFALANIALASSGDMLESRRNDEVDNAAAQLMKLAERYEEKGREFLSPFLSCVPPRRRGGKPAKNTSWTNRY